jgi:serine/threonine protein kinase
LSDAITLISLLDDNPPPDVARRIVRILDIGMISKPISRAYMSMEMVPGGNNLEKVIRKHHGNGMLVEASLHYLLRVLNALEWMHENDAVHGDIKPDNVLVGPDNDIVLTDFGLAARVDIGVLGGAIIYQAPEVLRHQGGEQAADVYAVGAMWYEMLTGRQPFLNVGLDAQARNDLRGYVKAQLDARKWPFRKGNPAVLPEMEKRIPPASEYNKELKDFPQLEAILERCLSARESERFSNAGMLRRDIEKYQKTGTVSPWVLLPNDCPGGGSDEQSVRSPEQRANDARALLHKEDRRDEALKIINELLDQDINFVPAILAEAIYFTYMGNKVEAQKQLGRAKKIDRNNPDVFDAMAEYFKIIGNVQQANRLSKQAERLRGKK